MTITVYRDEAGSVWIANGQGDILAECFFKTADETEDELRHRGYHRLLTVYPTAHRAAGMGLEPAELGGSFWRCAGRTDRARRQGPSAMTPPTPPAQAFHPLDDDTP